MQGKHDLASYKIRMQYFLHCWNVSHVRSGLLVRSWVRSLVAFVRTFVRAGWFVRGFVRLSCSFARSFGLAGLL